MPYHRSEEHTSELQSHLNLVCRLLLEKKKRRAIASETRVLGDHEAHASTRPAPRAHAGRDTQYVCCAPHLACDRSAHFFFFNDTATTEIYTLSLHDALPI